MTFTIANLVNGTEYEVQIWSRASFGQDRRRSTTVTRTATPAPPPPVQVSNIGRLDANPTTWYGLASNFSYAQGFTAGTHPLGYDLASVDVQVLTTSALSAADVAKVRAQLWESTTVDRPRVKFKDLKVPSSIETGTVTFEAPAGTVLAPGTTYNLVLYLTEALSSGQAVRWLTIPSASGDEDPGAKPGWSIADFATWYSGTSNQQPGNWTTFADPAVFNLRVNGAQSGWSAELTVAQRSPWLGCLSGAGTACSTQLDDDDFTAGGTDYEIVQLTLQGSSLDLDLDTPAGDDLRSLALCVGNTPFRMAEGTSGLTFAGNKFSWSAPSLTWAAGDKVSIGIRSSCSANDPAGVTVAGGPVGVEAGATATYTVVLNAKPTADVTVTPTSGTTDNATVSGAVTFTPSNWNTAQEITVTGVKAGTSTITHAATGSDTRYTSTLSIASVVVTVAPAAAGGVLVSNVGQEQAWPISNYVAAQGFTAGAAEGGYELKSIAAVLAAGANATQRATIRAELWEATSGGAPDSSNTTALTVPPTVAAGTVSFAAPANTRLSVGKTYFLVLYTTGTHDLQPYTTASEDEDEDGQAGWSIANGHYYQQTTGTPGGSWDAPFGNPMMIRVNGAAATATVTPAPTTLTLTTDAASDTAAEDAGTVTVTATLDNPAGTGGVEVTLAADAASTATATADYSLPAAFTIAEGDKTATGTVTIVDDDLDEDNETLVLTTTVAGLTVTDATLTITDNDDAPTAVALGVSPASALESAAATNITVTASLVGSRRTSDTAVTVSRTGGTATSGTDYAAISAFTVTIAAGASSGTATLSFDPTEDNLDEDNETVVLTGAAPSSLSLTAGTATLTITDDDTAGVTVSPTTLTVPKGSTATYDLVLNSRPTADVTVTPTSGTEANATVSGAVTFTPAQWNTKKQITVTGVTAGGTSTVTHAVTSSDPKYPSSLSIDSVAVTVANAYGFGQPSATVPPGTSISLNINLSRAAPAGGLLLSLRRLLGGAVPAGLCANTGDTLAEADDLGAGVPTSVRVDPGETSARFTVRPADNGDDRVLGKHECFVLSVGSSVAGWTADPARSTLQFRIYSASGQIAFGNDATSRSAHTATVAENVSGRSLSVPVSVDRLPAESTTFAVEVLDAGTSATEGTDFSIATKSVTFGPSDTSTTKNVTVALTDDAADEGNETIALRLKAANIINDPLRNFVYTRHASGSLATLTISDDDTAGVTVTPTSLPVGVGTTATYDLVLDSKPTANVTVTPTSGTEANATVSGAVTFTPAQWNTKKQVTVTGVKAGNSTITHAATSSDPKYPASLAINSVDVTVTTAPPVVALVSNVGQTTGSPHHFRDVVHAQQFTAGSNATGYNLASIEFEIINYVNAITSGDIQTIRAELWSSTDGDVPSKKLKDLEVPASISLGRNQIGTVACAAPAGTVLQKGAKYFAVLYTTADLDKFSIHQTRDSGEDDGAAAGWSIADNAWQYNQNTPSGGRWAYTGDIYQIRVNGSAVPGGTTTGPAAPTFSPLDGATVTNAGTNITLTFAEAIKKDNSNTDFSDADLAAILTLRQTDASGTPITYAATIDSAKTVITLNPSSNLPEGAVYVAISDAYFNAGGNLGSAASATFTVDSRGPAPTFSPLNDATLTIASSNISVSFDEAIKRNSGGGDFTTEEQLKALVTLRQTDAGGTPIGYSVGINSAKKLIIINPSANLPEGAVYVAVSDAYYDALGNQGSAASATFTVDSTGPSPTFSPLDGATVTNAATNITLTFAEAIKKNSSNADFSGHSDLAAIVDLRQTNSTGTAIPYAATIDSAKKVITLNPSADLPAGAVYVEIASDYYDAHGNQGSAASATFTVASAAPTVSGVALTSSAGTDNTYAIGDTVSATATFSTAVDVDTTDGRPQLELDFEGTAKTAAYASGTGTAALVFSYTVAEGDADADGIAIAANKLAPNGGTIKVKDGATAAVLTHQAVVESTSHKVDGVRPTLSSAAVSGTALTLTYSEALDTGSVPAAGDFTVKVAGTPVSLASGTPVAVSGSAVTLTLASAVTAGQTVTASYTMGTNPIRDSAGNDAANLTDQAVTVADSTGPSPTFSPLDGATVTNAGTNITLTFAEAIKKDSSNADFGNSDLASILTLRQTNSSGTTIPYAATIDGAKKVITINPTSNLPQGAIYVAISNDHYDAAGNQGSTASATFTVDSTGPAAPTFDPLNSATVTNAGRNITLTFAEAIKRSGGGDFTSEAHVKAILVLKQTSAGGTAIGYSASIDSAKKVITLNPTSDLPQGAVYVAVTDGYYDAHGNQGSTASATFTVDSTGVAAPTFSPLNNATVTDAGTNITLTFAEAIKKDSSNADFGNSDLASILTLRQTNSSGTTIPYAATIDGAKKVITIDPTSNLPQGAIYVAISNDHYDAAGNQGSTASATFTVDTAGPAAPTFDPLNSATVTNAGRNITLTFAEAIKRSGGGDFTSEAHVKAILVLKQTSAGGTAIGYSASIDSAKKVITLNPTSDLPQGAVYVAVTDGYYDAHGNQGSTASATFTVDSTGVAAPTFSPLNNATVTDAGTNITLTFAEAIKKDSSNADFGNSDLASILTLRQTNSSGTTIPYAATIDGAKKVITIDPTSNLPEGAIYVAISNDYYDAAGNQGSTASATFTVDTAGPAAPTFDPLNSATVTNAGRNITLTFAEAIKRSGGGDFTSEAHVKAILVLKQTSAGGTAIGYSASIDSAKKVITLNPTSDLPQGAVYVAVTDGYYDAHGNQGSTASATFTVDSTGVAAPTFSPLNNATVTDAGTNITLTFAEAIKKDSSNADFGNSDLASILTLRQTNSSGTTIPYAATINSAKTIITINPTSNLPQGAIYVAISNDHYDAAGNQGITASATFTVDTAGPAAPTFDPLNSATVTNAGRNITLTFAEAIKRSGGGDFTSEAHVKAILVLKQTSAGGTAIGYSASIDSAKKVITLNPTSDLPQGAVYVAVTDGYYDAHGNQGSTASATFTVDSTGVAAPTFSPLNNATVTDAGTNITLTFAEAIKKDSSNADFGNSDLASILTLRQTNSSGTTIPYAATINSAKTIITINPTSNLPEGAIYVAISSDHYDAAGNQGSTASATFTVDTAGPAAPTFDPLNSATVTNAGRNITLTFAEAIKRSGGGDFTSEAHVKAILVLKQTSAGGTAIGYSASIDSAKKVITLNPTSDLPQGAVYVAVTDGYYDAHGNQGSTASATFTVDSTGVAAPTFSPLNGATVTNAGTNITLTFAEAIKKDSSNADFGNSDLASILTLRQTNSSGTTIPYAATIDGAKKVITINPTSNLPEGAIYVAISSDHYDAAGNQGSTASATFTVDSTGPAAPTFDPLNSATVTNAGRNITLTFAEAIKRSGGGDFTSEAHVKAILVLKQTSAGGTAIGYSASIDSAKKVITLNPTSDLPQGAVYVAVTDGYYDAHGNQGSTASATFTVDSTGVAAPTFSPLNNATVTDAGTNITLTFAEAIKKDSSNADFGNSDLASILTLRQTNSSGTTIPYAATINSAKTIITINPTSNLPQGAIYVAISNDHYDAAGNQGSTASATFTVDSTGPAAPTFDPLNSATVTNAGRNITLTFAEAIKRSGGGDFTSEAHVKAILVLKQTSAGGTAIGYGASIDSAKKVITLNPTSDLPQGAVYVAVTDGYYDAHGNQGSTASATFTVDSTGVAAPTFSPLNNATVTDAGTNITLTFAEAIKKDSSNADFGNSDLASILTLRQTNSSGTTIPYAATINSAKTIITINPTSNLPEGAIYVAISSDHYDAAGNQGSTASATFTVDSTGPAAPTFDPLNSATVTNAGRNITLTFAEAIKRSGGGDFTSEAHVKAILVLKQTSAGGTAIGYGASIDSAKKVITLNPTSDLPQGAVYVAVTDGYYDAHGNQGSTASATFTVDSTGVAAPTFSPLNNATVTDAGTNITLTFAEAIKKDSSNADFGNSDLASILTLRQTNSSGTTIPYAATINSAKTIITINPTSNLPEGAIYVAISSDHYDAAGNQGSTASATFTVDSTGPAAPTFDPLNSATVTNAGRNITLTFAEAIKRSGGGDFTSEAHVKAILVLKQTSAGGTAIGYSASIDSAKKVITLNPTSDLPQGAVYVAVTDGYYDAHGNQGSTASATFTVDSTGVAAPTFSPLNNATVTDAGTNITLTFAEAIKKDSSNADFGNSDLASILTLRQTNSSGTTIPYAATINSAKTIITINPTSNLPEGAVYVAISNAYYDASGNQGAAASATFTVETPSSDATLSALTATTSSDGTTFSDTLNIGTFAATTASYAATVANAVTHVKLTPTVTEPGATVAVGRLGRTLVAVTSRQASGAIALGVGPNAITVRVTAQDSTTMDYTVTITRQAQSALAASSSSAPATHDGSSAFSVRLRFSEPVMITDEAAFRDHSVEALGGTATDAERLDGTLWEVTVDPDGGGAVIVALLQTGNCSDAGALCTSDGRRLTARVEVLVRGPDTAVVTIAPVATAITEGEPAAFRLRRAGGTGPALSVGLSVSGAADFIAGSPPQTAAFPADDAVVSLDIPTEDDALGEPGALLTVELSEDTASPPAYVLGSPSRAILQVRDNDGGADPPLLPGTSTAPPVRRKPLPLQLALWTDKPAYRAGETVRLYYTAHPHDDHGHYRVFAWLEPAEGEGRRYLAPLSPDAALHPESVDIRGLPEHASRARSLPRADKALAFEGEAPEPGLWRFVLELRPGAEHEQYDKPDEPMRTRRAWASFTVAERSQLLNRRGFDREIRTDLTLRSDTIYYLGHQLFVHDGATLTIEPGTVVRASGSNTAIIVEPGGRIVAEGTPEAPVVLTCSVTVGRREPGCWGGLRILGRAPLTRLEGVAPGVLPAERPVYGGTDGEDSGGVLRYVRVEFAGAAADPEVPGPAIGLYGAGSGTILDHVQAHASLGDGFAFHGGTAVCDHCVASGSGNAGLSWERGWRGGASHLYVQHGGTGLDGLAGSNDEQGHDLEPRSLPTLSNVTLIHSWPYGRRVRKAVAVRLSSGSGVRANDLLATRFQGGAIWAGGRTALLFKDGESWVASSLFYLNGDGGRRQLRGGLDAGVEFLGSRDPKLGDVRHFPNPDPRPKPDSPALHDEGEGYMGAFGRKENWLEEWTVFGPESAYDTREATADDR